MKLKIKVHPNSSQEKIEKNDGKLEIWLKEKPIDNKVNLKLEKMLKKYIGKPVKLKSGFKSRKKIVEILE